MAGEFSRLGFSIKATKGTHDFLATSGITTELILKLHEGRPNIDDAIKNGDIQLVINTPVGKASQYDDSYIRKAAITYKVPYITTIAAALAGGSQRHLRIPQGQIRSKIPSGVSCRYQVAERQSGGSGFLSSLLRRPKSQNDRACLMP